MKKEKKPKEEAKPRKKGSGGPRPNAGRPKEEDKQALFLGAYAATCNVRVACEKAGIVRSTYRNWKSDPDFAARLSQAHADAVEDLYAAGFERAVKGVGRIKFNSKTGQPYMVPDGQGGFVPYVEREYSDTVLLAYLRANDKRFVDRRELTGKDGAPLAVDINDPITDEERISRLAAILDAARARGSGSAADGAETPELS